MTQQEILDFNKRCSEFLSLEIAGPGFPSGYFYKNEYYHFEDLQFHSDWNWIMEVVERIYSLPLDVRTYTVQNLKLVNSKEVVVQAINQFLISYK